MGNKCFKSSQSEVHSNTSIFCEILQKQNFDSLHGPKLEEMLKSGKRSKKFGNIEKKLYCHLGNGKNEVFTIPEIVNELFIRNYPEFSAFTGTER